MSEPPTPGVPDARAVHIVPALQAVRAVEGAPWERGWRVAGFGVSLAVPGVARHAATEAPLHRSDGTGGGAAARQDAVRFRLLDAEIPGERARWLEVWRRWPAREVMAHPEYVALFARPGERVVAALGEGDGAGVLFPLILRPLAAEPWASPGEDRWDATTPYGYGGPWALGAAREVPEFWGAYEDWCRGAGVVTTFARMTLFADELAAVPGPAELHGPNVVVPLAAGREAVWEGYDRDVRRRVRVARREGLAVEVDLAGARLREFHAVYLHTMVRRGAEPWYHLPLAFFERLVERLEGQFAFVHAIAGGRVVSSELALVSRRNVYAFLGGTSLDAFRHYPNELVRDATIEWAIREGKERYVLGGGRAPEDGILRHKRLLAPGGELPFRTARLVHDPVANHALARRRALAELEHGGWTPRPGFFPAYRA